MTAAVDASRPRLPPWMGLGAAVLLSVLLFWQSRDALRDRGSLVIEHQILHYTLGELHLLTGDLESATAAFERTLRNDPQAFGAQVALGKVSERQGRPAVAMSHYQKALALMPGHVDAHVSLGNLLLGQGKVREACVHYRAALATQPQEHAALTNLAWIMASSAEDDLRDGERALSMLTRALAASDGADPRLLLFQAAAQAETGRFEEAQKTVLRAIEIARQTGHQALVGIGQAHLHSYRNRQALRVAAY